MATYTKAEIAAINEAHRSISHLCSCTNWGDGPAWREAERLERRQCASDETQKGPAARAMICKAWLEGLEGADKAARDLYWIRQGYLTAFLLGVRHHVEREGSEYCGPMVEKCREACRAAVAANEAHTRRIVEG